MKDAQKSWNALKPDAQGFDEVRIITVPRWKESELSGDEWRIHAEVQFMRKGEIIHTDGCRNIETACGMVYGMLMKAQDDGKAFFAGDGIHCDQEGCSAPFTVKYQKKFTYERDGMKRELSRPELRHFCDRHKHRGDCALDDADRNYILID